MRKSPMFRPGLSLLKRSEERLRIISRELRRNGLEYSMVYNETSRAHGGKYLRSLTGYQTNLT